MKNVAQSVILCVFFLSGCSLPFHGSAPINYRLALSEFSAPQAQKTNLRLIVRETLASGITDSHKISFSKSPVVQGSYQYAVWVETPARQLTSFFIEELQASHMFVSVSRATSGGVGDVQLNSELNEFVHEVAKGKIHIVLGVELIDLETRRVYASDRFQVDVPVEQNDAEGAVEAFSKGSMELGTKLFDWLKSLELGSLRGAVPS